MIDERGLQNIANWLAEELKKELRDQGHKDTGTLMGSIDPDITTDGLSKFIEISMNAYAIYLNEGVKGSRVRTPIDVLQKWVERRLGKRGKEARSIAFAIRTIQMREGMPTKNSRRYSKNGRRTGFIDDTLDRVDNLIFQKVQDLAAGSVQVEVDRIIRDFNKGR